MSLRPYCFEKMLHQVGNYELRLMLTELYFKLFLDRRVSDMRAASAEATQMYHASICSRAAISGR